MSQRKRPFSRNAVIITSLLMMLALLIAVPVSAAQAAPLWIDPKTIPKYVNQINGPPPVYVPVSGNYYEVNATMFSQQILPSPYQKPPYGGMAGWQRMR